MEEEWCSISSSIPLMEDGWVDGKIDGLCEGKKKTERERVEATSLSVPAHISSRRAKMCGSHSKPITKLIK